MRVVKWGTSLAIRLPAAIVEALALRAGDEIEVRVAPSCGVEIDRGQAREHALTTIRSFRKALPSGWNFDREEASER